MTAHVATSSHRYLPFYHTMTERTELSALGEFALIERLTSSIVLQQPSSVTGVGDDAAVLASTGQSTVVTTDMLLEGVHFDLAYTPLKHLGYKAVVVNLSDLAAMNAAPAQFTFSLAASNRFSVEALDELYAGVLAACEAYGVDLVGGDTCSSRSGLVISVTALGHATPEMLVKRSGARVNDLVCVTGDLGAAYLGLQILEREKQVFLAAPGAQPLLEGYDYLLRRQLRPEARTDMRGYFSEAGLLPTSMIDISDGLASEVLHITRASGCGCRLYEEKFPLDPMTIRTAEELGLDSTTCALNGGEDYELLFTISPSDFEKIKGSPHITVIGHITEEAQGDVLVTRSGAGVPLQAQGWRAF